MKEKRKETDGSASPITKLVYQSNKVGFFKAKFLLDDTPKMLNN